MSLDKNRFDKVKYTPLDNKHTKRLKQHQFQYDVKKIAFAIILLGAYVWMKAYQTPSCDDFNGNFGSTRRDGYIRKFHDAVKLYEKKKKITVMVYLEGGTLLQSLRYGRIDPHAWDDIGFVIDFPKLNSTKAKKQYRALCEFICPMVGAIDCTCKRKGYGIKGIFLPKSDLDKKWENMGLPPVNHIDMFLYKSKLNKFRDYRFSKSMVLNQTKKCMISGRRFYCTNDPIRFLCSHPKEKYCESCPMLPPNYDDERKKITRDVYFSESSGTEGYVKASERLHLCGFASFAPLILENGGFENNTLSDVARKCKAQLQAIESVIELITV